MWDPCEGWVCCDLWDTFYQKIFPCVWNDGKPGLFLLESVVEVVELWCMRVFVKGALCLGRRKSNLKISCHFKLSRHCLGLLFWRVCALWVCVCVRFLICCKTSRVDALKNLNELLWKIWGPGLKFMHFETLKHDFSCFIHEIIVVILCSQISKYCNKTVPHRRCLTVFYSRTR